MFKLRANVKAFIPSRLEPLVIKAIHSLYPHNWGFNRKIELSNFLQGGELGLSGIHWAKYTGDMTRTSKVVSQFPHYKLLSDYAAIGDDVFKKDNFLEHPYYLNARAVIVSGKPYHGAINFQQIKELAQKFIRDSQKISENNKRIRARKVKGSNFFQIVDGHHRVSAKVFHGKTRVRSKVDLFTREKTGIQELVQLTFWNNSEKVLYQPLPIPDLSNLPLVRRCEDRLDKMLGFLKSQEGFFQENSSTFLDIGSYFGYFSKAFKDHGWTVSALERDPFACKIANLIYELQDEEILEMDLESFLQNSTEVFDVVSCLSVLHHFLNEREVGNAGHLLNQIASKTRGFLFLEMGTEEENWFMQSLKGWNLGRVIDWVFENTDFDGVELLGRDADGINKYSGQFGRELMVFFRKETSR